ncbi:MAG: MBL fold metallo-hydrolase [Clostridia bacterium]|nr:MBL fold metallo-hydrolase [Clostridia bacterium]
MRVCNLCSGSKGNCTYIETDNTRILIDCGKPFSYISEKLKELEVEPDLIQAILITHEHSDHIKGVDSFARRFNTPVYVHTSTLEIMQNQIHIDRNQFITFDSTFDLNDLSITPFPLPHDSKYCVGYRISQENAVVSICTDLGQFSEDTFEIIKSSALVYLESNYDPEMLMSYPNYPPFLKRRINGRNGHLSNLNCAQAIEKLYKTGTRLVVLSHISEHSNNVNLAVGTIAKYLNNKNIIPNKDIRLDITYQDQRGTIFRINPKK